MQIKQRHHSLEQIEMVLWVHIESLKKPTTAYVEDVMLVVKKVPSV